MCVAVCYSVLQCVAVCCSLYLDTVWRRLRGCLKLQVIFRKMAINHRALLWEMTYRDKASYGSLQQMTHMYHMAEYGVATISRLLKVIGLFCRI